MRTKKRIEDEEKVMSRRLLLDVIKNRNKDKFKQGWGIIIGKTAYFIFRHEKRETWFVCWTSLENLMVDEVSDLIVGEERDEYVS